jgi:hypothetical protein
VVEHGRQPKVTLALSYRFVTRRQSIKHPWKTHMSLRELAKTWVKANCPSTDLQNDFLKRLDDALQRGVGCSFIVGRELTKSTQPYLVCGYCGEFFAFQLTPSQATRMKVQDRSLVTSVGGRPHNHEPHPEPLVQLTGVKIDNAEQLDRSARIAGSLSISSGQLWAMPLAVQVVCEAPGSNSVILCHHFGHLPRGEDTLRFSLPPLIDLKDSEGRPFAGLLPLFIQIGIVGEPEANSKLNSNGLPKAPTFGQPPPVHPSMSMPGAMVQQRLGEHFVPPSPVPSLMTPDTMNFPPRPNAEPLPPLMEPSHRFRAISDISAVLVQIY